MFQEETVSWKISKIKMSFENDAEYLLEIFILKHYLDLPRFFWDSALTFIAQRYSYYSKTKKLHLLTVTTNVKWISSSIKGVQIVNDQLHDSR